MQQNQTFRKKTLSKTRTTRVVFVPLHSAPTSWHPAFSPETFSSPAARGQSHLPAKRGMQRSKRKKKTSWSPKCQERVTSCFFLTPPEKKGSRMIKDLGSSTRNLGRNSCGTGGWGFWWISWVPCVYFGLGKLM